MNRFSEGNWEPENLRCVDHEGNNLLTKAKVSRFPLTKGFKMYVKGQHLGNNTEDYRSFVGTKAV